MPRRSRRRALSMTSLIDVIFLLLLFFMLSSTFSRYSDVALDLGGASAAGGASVEGAAFLRLSEAGLDLNGAPLDLEGLAPRLAALEAGLVIVSVRPEVSAQRLTDLLVTLDDGPDVDVVLMGDG